MRQRHSAIFWIMLTMPVVMVLTATLLPTHDDWTATPGPNPDPLSWSLLLPQYSYWRIPENIYGWLVAHVRWLFPALGHCIVLAGHYTGCYMVHRLCRLLGMSSVARNIATVFYFVSVGMMATVTACDGMSQTWVQTLGLIALYTFLKDADRGILPRKWLAIILTACFVKENALSWFYIIPFIGIMLGKVDWRVVKRLALPVVVLTAAYVMLRFTVPVRDSYEFNDDYTALDPMQMIKGFTELVMQTWVPIDYASLIHHGHRNLLVVGITAITSLPFVYLVFCHRQRLKRNRMVATFGMAFVLCSAIHIVTIFALMHIYSSIGMAALLLASLIDSDTVTPRRRYTMLFAVYAMTAICVDAHHYVAAWQSGTMGRNLSRQAVENTLRTLGRPAERVFIVTSDEYSQYSNFYVLPVASMGWGKGAQWETEFAWPKEIDNEEVNDSINIKAFVQKKLNEGYDCVWIVTPDSVYVRH